MENVIWRFPIQTNGVKKLRRSKSNFEVVKGNRGLQANVK